MTGVCEEHETHRADCAWCAAASDHRTDTQHYLAEGFIGTLVSCGEKDAHATVNSGRNVAYCPLCGGSLHPSDQT